MPVQLTYPGVYIEEISSGVHTIVGVATSVTAFVGAADRGPANVPTTIHSFAEYENTFGAVSDHSPMSYAVRDFYLNGGAEAIIVRLTDANAAKAQLPADTLALEASSPGTWGNGLKARVEVPPDPDVFSDEVARMLNPGAATPLTHNDLFHLILWDPATGAAERFDNLTTKESSRRVDRVLKAESQLAKVPDDSVAALGQADSARPKRNAKTNANKSPFNDKEPGDATDTGTDVTPSLWYTATAESGKDVADTGLTASDYHGDGATTGLYALEGVDLFNLLCIPPPLLEADTDMGVWTEAVVYCTKRRAFLLVDPPIAWKAKANARDGLQTLFQAIGSDGAKRSAVYFPFLVRKDQLGLARSFVPSGAVAGVIGRTDTQRGVWKAPAGLDAGVVGADALSVNLNADDQGELNPIGINCLRVLPGAGRVVYGARTLAGNDLLASEWKYVPIRRLALFLEESLFRGTQWVVFEPNDEPLWAQIRANVGAFLHDLFRQGAFEGSTPQQAYYVRCDGTTTTASDRDRGIVNIEVGFSPLKPAEFVVIKIQQMAGQAG